MTTTNKQSNYIDIVFDGPPAPEAGRFVEVEDAHGHSIAIGEWVKRDAELYALRFPDPRAMRDEIDQLRAERDAAITRAESAERKLAKIWDVADCIDSSSWVAGRIEEIMRGEE